VDLARALITTLVDEDKLNEVNRSGIDTTFLQDSECETVFSYIQRHYTEYKKVPSRGAIKQAFPNFEFTAYAEPLEYFIDAIKETYRRSVLEDALLEINRRYSSDTQAAESLIRDALTRLAVTQRTFKDMDLADNATARFDTYIERTKNPGANGILSGWEAIDYCTLGWHAEELIVLVGEKYLGKSWLMLWLAYQAMIQGERVLFVTKEMSAEAMANRFDSIYAGVKFDSLRRGELSNVEEKKLEKALSTFGAKKGEGKITLSRHGISSIADIEQKAVEVDATTVFVDSVYLFNADSTDRPGSETQRRMAVSQRSKLAAQTLGIPVIVSTQAGRKKAGIPAADLDNIEWSNAFAQDADVVLMITKDEIDRELGRLKMHILKSRDGDIGKANIKTDFEYMQFPQDVSDPEPSFDIDIEEDSSDNDVLDFEAGS
jgi:replicative DNA helicase